MNVDWKRVGAAGSLIGGIAALVLLRASVPAHPGTVGVWLTDSRRRAAVAIARRTRIVSRWLTFAGLVSALVLLVGVGISAWVELLFPAWILALSLDILVKGPGNPSAEQLAGSA